MSEQITPEIKCPKCGSTQLFAGKKGFSGKKAVAGAVITGGIGLLAGTIGSNKIKITCLNCGNVFQPGDSLKPTQVQTPIIVIKNLDPADKDLVDIIQHKGKLEAVKFYKDNNSVTITEANSKVEEVIQKYQLKAANQMSTGGCLVLILLAALIAYLIWANS
jgi:DNA-directed RNA polymerase subunit RPC12/RpoP